ncbi:hypothetical protein VKT23_012579 [Stygiomarasmius scandens]|uniref:Uncharacterized protein n=1 Tax=Marasmiellus scandens TaxID=2682957 RepID=A0ABR1J868_9AGAR
MVYVPQTAFILQLIHIPQYLEEFRLSFELQPLDSMVNHRAVPVQGVYEEWMRIPQYPQVLVDRGLADFLHRHRTITHLDLGIVSEVFITNPRLCKPFPSTALPSLKIMRVHISFLPYMISTSTSLPALEEVELHITHREVQSTWGGADIPHDRDLYRAGMAALSRHGGRIQSLQISLFARVVSMAQFSDLFTLQGITLPGIEKFTIAAVEIDAAAKLTEMIAWVGRVLPDATELCIVKTKNWSRHRKRSFVSGVTQECPSIKKIGIDAEAKPVQDWLG